MSGLISQSFNPYQYTTNTVTESKPEETESQEERFDEIVTKGGKKVFKVDIGHFDKLCRKFRDKAEVRIKNLTGRDREDFKLMVSYVRLLYGTNYYDHLYSKVEKYFSDLKEVNPGTVGGYFGGCLVSTSFGDQPGCSAVCAGAVPRPKDDEGWSFCDKAVIFAERNGNRGYTFNVLKEPESPEEMEPCYVFVEHTNLHDFEGFSEKERKQLEDLGVNQMYLIGCNENGTEYVNLYGDVCKLSDIKHRKKKHYKSDASSLGLALLLIVIFLLFTVLFFGWRFWDKDYKL
jgi:hypothetical protein